MVIEFIGIDESDTPETINNYIKYNVRGGDIHITLYIWSISNAINSFFAAQNNQNPCHASRH